MTVWTWPWPEYDYPSRDEVRRLQAIAVEKGLGLWYSREWGDIVTSDPDEEPFRIVSGRLTGRVRIVLYEGPVETRQFILWQSSESDTATVLQEAADYLLAEEWIAERVMEKGGKAVQRAALDLLDKRERDGLCTFRDGYRIWLVRDDFVDSDQSPAVLFVRDKAIGAFELEAWPGPAFEYYKQVLDNGMSRLIGRI